MIKYIAKPQDRSLMRLTYYFIAFKRNQNDRFDQAFNIIYG